jgi:hypothetical protein
MPHVNLKGMLLIAAAILVLFGAIELYALQVFEDWSIVNPTVTCQLLAITLAVAPMMYGLIYASHQQDR